MIDQTGPEDLLQSAANWHDAGRPVAVATVVETWGSSPRPVGSQLIVATDGDMLGSVSGGCIEGAVVDAAKAVIETKTPKLLEFGVSDELAWEVGLACGGTVKVYVEALGATMTNAALRHLIEVRRGINQPAALVTALSSGDKTVVLNTGSSGPLALKESELAAINRHLLSDRSGRLAENDDLFVACFNPPLRLFVVGAVHIAQSLLPMAALAGYATTLIDPRRAWSTEARFPNLAISQAWPDEALEAANLDHRSAVVALTHDPKLDDPALQVALMSDAFYIGALGSKRTHAARNERLKAQGLSDERLARIHGPIGLPLGGRNPQEISIAILAEMTQVRHRLAEAGA